MRTIYLFFTIFLLPKVLYSQSDEKEFFIGGQFGFCFANAEIDHNIYSININSKFNLGYTASIIFKSLKSQDGIKNLKLGYQFGLEYTKKGWNQVFNNQANISTELYTFQVPLNAIVSYKPRNLMYSLNLGIFLDYIFKNAYSNDPIEELVLNEHFYTFDSQRGDKNFGYGINSALSLMHKLGVGNIYVDIYFNYSLSNFINNEIKKDFTPDISHLYNIGTSFGYYFSWAK